MKKWIKYILLVIFIILVLFIIDLVCIFTISRPLLAIKENDFTYKGIFYNTYNCEEYSLPQIKFKWEKYNCSSIKINLGKAKNIVDKTKEIKDFACDDMLEEFYKDNDYTYYWSCLKNEYIIVEYENGYEENVSNALKYGTIKVEDLDNYNIDYIKEKR